MSEPTQNGTSPATETTSAEAPCEDCATGGEKILAVVAGAFGLFVIAMAIDMFSGGALSRMLVPAREATGE